MAAPTISINPDGGRFTEDTLVTITTSRGSTIYYSVWPNGAWTHTASGQTEVSFTLTRSGNVRFFAVASDTGEYTASGTGAATQFIRAFIINKVGYPVGAYEAFCAPFEGGHFAHDMRLTSDATDNWIVPSGMSAPGIFNGRNLGSHGGVPVQSALCDAGDPVIAKYMALWRSDTFGPDQEVWVSNNPIMADYTSEYAVARMSSDGLNGYAAGIKYPGEAPFLTAVADIFRIAGGVWTHLHSVDVPQHQGDYWIHSLRVWGQSPVNLQLTVYFPDAVVPTTGVPMSEAFDLRDWDGDGINDWTQFAVNCRATWQPLIGVESTGGKFVYWQGTDSNENRALSGQPGFVTSPGGFDIPQFWAYESPVVALPAALSIPSEVSDTTGTTTGSEVALDAGEYVEWVVDAGEGGTFRLDGTMSGPGAVRVSIDGAAPDPMTTAHRTTGVAPLAVCFDAVDTVENTSTNETGQRSFAWTSGVTQPSDILGSHYEWDFGDPSSGTWTQTGLSKNTATGFTAAHVYESAGTYTVTLTVTDTEGVVRVYAQDVTVSAFSGATGYASASGVAAAPGTELAPTSLAAGITWVNAAANRRLLLNRGDTFSTGTITLSRAQGTGQAGILGAYGSGNRPILSTTAQAVNITASEWKVLDVEALGPVSTSLYTGMGMTASASMSNVLFRGCKVTRYYTPFGWDSGTNIFHHAIAIVECESAGDPGLTSGDYGFGYVGAHWLMLLGNYGHDSSYTHICRVWSSYKGVVSHNRFEDSGEPAPNAGRQAIKFTAESRTASPDKIDTRWNCITDNRLRGKTWGVTLGPIGNDYPEYVLDTLYERNIHTSTASHNVTTDVEVQCQRAMIRNNVLNAAGASGATVSTYRGFVVEQRGISPAPVPDDIRVYHNTIVLDVASSTRNFEGVTVLDGSTNVQVRGNLAAHAGGTGTRTAVNSTAAGAGYAGANNLVSASPGFTNGAAGDFTLTSESPALGQGVELAEVLEDFARADRPATPDLGAYERA